MPEMVITVYIVGCNLALLAAGFWWNRINELARIFTPFAAAAWPFVAICAVVFGLAYIPFWLGRWAAGHGRRGDA